SIPSTVMATARPGDRRYEARFVPQGFRVAPLQLALAATLLRLARRRRRIAKARGTLGVAGHVLPGRILKLLAVVAVFVGDAAFQRIVRLGLDEELTHRFENGRHLCGRFPVLR